MGVIGGCECDKTRIVTSPPLVWSRLGSTSWEKIGAIEVIYMMTCQMASIPQINESLGTRIKKIRIDRGYTYLDSEKNPVKIGLTRARYLHDFPNPNKFYDTGEWWTKRSEILERDYHECSKCKGYADQVHHVLEVKFAPQVSYFNRNLVSLCRKCHYHVHSFKSKGNHTGWPMKKNSIAAPGSQKIRENNGKGEMGILNPIHKFDEIILEKIKNEGMVIISLAVENSSKPKNEVWDSLQRLVSQSRLMKHSFDGEHMSYFPRKITAYRCELCKKQGIEKVLLTRKGIIYHIYQNHPAHYPSKNGMASNLVEIFQINEYIRKIVMDGKIYLQSRYNPLQIFM